MRISRTSLALSAAFAVIQIQGVRAQTVDQSVCSILASKLTPDLSRQTSADVRSGIYRNIAKSEAYRAFGAANSATLDAGLTVVGYVDATLGTTSDSSNWEKNWSSFSNMTTSEFATASQSTNFSSRYNPALIQSLLKDCQTASFYGQLVNVSATSDAFIIKLHGINKWQLTSLKANPPDAKFACGGDEAATDDKPIDKIADRLLTCVKDPNQTISVTVSSSLGDAGPFEIYSVADGLRHQIDDSVGATSKRVSALEQEVQRLRSQTMTDSDQLKNVSSALQVGRTELSYVIVPRGADCPVGWSYFGTIGFLMTTSDVDRAGLGRGGAYASDGHWTWTHPQLCKRQ
jgi:hypothetical protein